MSDFKSWVVVFRAGFSYGKAYIVATCKQDAIEQADEKLKAGEVVWDNKIANDIPKIVSVYEYQDSGIEIFQQE